MAEAHPESTRVWSSLPRTDPPQPGSSNPMGEHAERWCHSFGCGQWFNVLRDTVTHEIVTTYGMGESRG